MLGALRAVDEVRLILILVPPELLLCLAQARRASFSLSLLHRMNLSVVPLLAHKFRHIKVIDYD